MDEPRRRLDPLALAVLGGAAVIAVGAAVWLLLSVRSAPESTPTKAGPLQTLHATAPRRTRRCFASSPTWWNCARLPAGDDMRATILGGILSAALLLGWQVPCASQTEAPVARPAVKPGDRWVYNRMDYWANRVVTVRTIEITMANDKVIQLVATEPGKPEMDETFSADWNSIATTVNNSVPDSGHLKFPLRVGATYPVEYESVFGPQRNWRSKHERKARVVGWEEITVPAGKFRALKVEVEGSFQRLDTSLAGTAKTTIWYVPEVKRWAKLIFEDNILMGPQRGPFNKFGEELVQFKLQ